MQGGRLQADHLFVASPQHLVKFCELQKSVSLTLHLDKLLKQTAAYTGMTVVKNHKIDILMNIHQSLNIMASSTADFDVVIQDPEDLIQYIQSLVEDMTIQPCHNKISLPTFALLIMSLVREDDTGHRG